MTYEFFENLRYSILNSFRKQFTIKCRAPFSDFINMGRRLNLDQDFDTRSGCTVNAHG